jgi:Leucine-rich repeat (LRR) protein
MTTEIETYLNSLSEDILTLNISGKCKGIKSLLDLTRFKNLKTLKCSDNQLTSLPTLPQNIEKLYCYHNQLKSLPTLPQNLKELYCNSNQLTYLPNLPQNLETLDCSNNKLNLLPTLPQNLEVLDCSDNQLTSLPTLPQKLEKLICFDNQLTYLPTLPQNIEELNCSDNELNYLPTLPQNLEYLYCSNYCSNNPIYEIVNNDSLITIKQNIQTLNNFRHLYYSLKFNIKFEQWLLRSKEEKIMEQYHPDKIIKLLESGVDIFDLEQYL